MTLALAFGVKFYATGPRCGGLAGERDGGQPPVNLVEHPFVTDGISHLYFVDTPSVTMTYLNIYDIRLLLLLS